MKSTGTWGPSAALWFPSLEGSRVLALLLSHIHTTFAVPHKILSLVQDTPRRCEAGREITNAGRTTSAPSTSSLQTASLLFYFFLSSCFYTWGAVIPVDFLLAAVQAGAKSHLYATERSCFVWQQPGTDAQPCSSSAEDREPAAAEG